MKKVTMMIVGVIYVVGIVIVGLYGMRIFSLYDEVRATSVRFLESNEGYYIGKNEYGEAVFSIRLKALEYINGDRTYKIKCLVTPKDATNPKLRFIFEERIGQDGLPQIEVDQENQELESSWLGWEITAVMIVRYPYSFSMKAETVDGSHKSDEMRFLFL